MDANLSIAGTTAGAFKIPSAPTVGDAAIAGGVLEVYIKCKLDAFDTIFFRCFLTKPEPLTTTHHLVQTREHDAQTSRTLLAYKDKFVQS